MQNRGRLLREFQEKEMVTEIQTDVLVVGGGASGVRAALEAKK